MRLGFEFGLPELMLVVVYSGLIREVNILPAMESENWQTESAPVVQPLKGLDSLNPEP